VGLHQPELVQHRRAPDEAAGGEVDHQRVEGEQRRAVPVLQVEADERRLEGVGIEAHAGKRRRPVQP
jgi:hypothetical protein